MSKLVGIILLWSFAAVALAHYDRDDDGDYDSDKHWHHYQHDPLAAPEIDPVAAGSALTLLAGCLAVVRGRRSKK